MSLHLYELADAYRDAIALADDTGGEITPEIESLLDQIEGGIEEKADSIAALCREWKLEALGCKEEKDRLAARQKAAENRIEGLKSYLQFQLERMGIDKVKTKRFNIRCATAGVPSIRWIGEGSIPSGFDRVKVELDGNAARDAWAEKRLPAGFKVEFSKYLDIR